MWGVVALLLTGHVDSFSLEVHALWCLQTDCNRIALCKQYAIGVLLLLATSISIERQCVYSAGLYASMSADGLLWVYCCLQLHAVVDSSEYNSMAVHGSSVLIEYTDDLYMGNQSLPACLGLLLLVLA